MSFSTCPTHVTIMISNCTRFWTRLPTARHDTSSNGAIMMIDSLDRSSELARGKIVPTWCRCIEEGHASWPYWASESAIMLDGG
eukprot:5172197-Amphidinium_carterae.1